MADPTLCPSKLGVGVHGAIIHFADKNFSIPGIANYETGTAKYL